MTDINTSANRKLTLQYDAAAWIIAAIALLFALLANLLPALLAGLLVYELVHILAPRIKLKSMGHRKGRVLAVAVVAVVVVVALTLIVFGAAAFFRSDAGNLPALLKKMAEILDSSRAALPVWAAEYLPADTAGLKGQTAHWLREHASELQVVGKETGRALAYILIGMVIGAMLCLRDVSPNHDQGPLARALTERTSRLGDSFRRIVFAQVRIAAINTAITGVYLAVVLPLLGVHLPFTKTMIGITFIAGLLPVVGNLISNTVIVVVSLSYSIYVAAGSLLFLIVIHKFEYFLNARIVSSRIHSRAWELLVAMLVMEATFGIPGLIAAPIYYAYVKNELASRRLV